MKGSYFGEVQARSKNTFIVLYYTFIFKKLAQWLPNDSLNDSFFQTPFLCDAAVIGSIGLIFMSYRL